LQTNPQEGLPLIIHFWEHCVPGGHSEFSEQLAKAQWPVLPSQQQFHCGLTDDGLGAGEGFVWWCGWWCGW